MTRRRYRYDEATGTMYEVATDAPVTPRVEISTDTHYDGLRATDGTAIDSRRKHREYLKATGLAMADDFKQTWAEAPAKRAQAEDARRAAVVDRVWHDTFKGGKRGR